MTTIKDQNRLQECFFSIKRQFNQPSGAGRYSYPPPCYFPPNRPPANKALAHAKAVFNKANQAKELGGFSGTTGLYTNTTRINSSAKTSKFHITLSLQVTKYQ